MEKRKQINSVLSVSVRRPKKTVNSEFIEAPWNQGAFQSCRLSIIK